MKNILSLLLPFAILISGCIQEESGHSQIDFQDGRVFTASFEQAQTRTYVEDGNLLRWTAGDQISLFDGNTLNRQYKFDGETGDNSGTFSIVDAPYGSGNDLAANYAVYPYASNTKIAESGVMTITLPAEQSYAENSFGLGANTMVAVTKNVDDTFLKFRNVCGYLKLRLYGDDVTVKSITLIGNNNEKLAGKATITPAYGQFPTLAMSDDATTSITLDCGEGVKIGATKETATAFWIVLPPTTFEEGLTITVTEIDGESFTKSTSNAVVVERNIIKPMAAFEVEIEKIPNNQIWYTSSDGNVVTPNSQATFGVNIESNVYVDGKGVITFDGEVTKIGTVSFNGCYNLKSITIPSSITTIENAVFVSCPNLAEFKGKYASDGGRCLIKDNAIIAYANASGTEYTIPDNVTTVWNGAFGFCPSLSNITIPETVTTIQPVAFLCPNLKTINGKYATEDGRFYIIDGSIKIFAPYELTECVIPNSVTTIECNTFVSANFTSVTIPDSVTAIESNAFAGCYNLTNIYCKATIPPTAVFHYNTWDWDPFTSNVIIYVPIDSVYEYRKAVGWNNYADRIVAFDYDKGEAVISNNIIYYTSVDGNIIKPYNIGEYVFGAEIVSNTYENGLGIIKFDRDVLSVGFNAFKWCNTLTSIVIPDSVAEIGTCAFYECSNLTSVTIGDKVTSIGDDAFRLCSNITSVHITDIESWCNIKFNNFASNPLRCDLYVGGELLTNLVIPNSVTSIGDWAFQYCESLTSVTIPDSVTTIGNEAFDNCESLTSVTIGDSVTTIGERAFHSCGSLTSVTIGNSVTTIGDFAFGGCSLTSVTIPDSVVIVGDEAFYLCSNLREFKGKLASVDGRCLIVDGVLNSFAPAGVTEYNIPYGVTAIGNSAFYYCKNITKVTIPDSVTAIDDNAFLDCENLTSVTIGNNVITIGERAFEYCTSLSSMIIPDSVITIGDYALHYCKNLTNIVIGNHVTLLGQGVLCDCDNLTSVTMGDRVTTIGYLAFNDCDNLTAITIPASVTSIESDAFAECDKLTKIYCKSSTPTMVSYPKYWCAFDNNASYRKIYVPRGSGDAYKSASGWSDYASDIVEYDF